MFDYTSTEPGDLTFRAGDVILVERSDGEWWRGSINGRAGMFPANYVKLQVVEQNVSNCEIRRKSEIWHSEEQNEAWLLTNSQSSKLCLRIYLLRNGGSCASCLC
jgi:hypothetical protein